MANPSIIFIIKIFFMLLKNFLFNSYFETYDKMKSDQNKAKNYFRSSRKA